MFCRLSFVVYGLVVGIKSETSIILCMPSSHLILLMYIFRLPRGYVEMSSINNLNLGFQYYKLGSRSD